MLLSIGLNEANASFFCLFVCFPNEGRLDDSRLHETGAIIFVLAHFALW